MDTDIAIIGNGCAARSAMETIRQSGFKGRVDAFSASSLPAYNPMLTTYFLSGKITSDQLLQSSDDDFYAKNEIRLHLDTPIAALDADKKIIRDISGNSCHYESCLIASGAAPFVPPIGGATENGVFVVRTAEDVLKIRAYMDSHPVHSALVVGASMVGIKVAEYLLQENIVCCLADGAGGIFPLSAHPHCQTLIQASLLRQGLKLRFGGNIVRIARRQDGLAAFFSDSQEPLLADVIFLCIGVRPRLSFLSSTGPAVKGGILVDDKMRTSCRDLYAAGDCTAGYDLYYHDKRVIGLLANARLQGRTAGRNMAGGNDSYCGSTAHNITHFMDMDFVSIGNPLAQGQVFEQVLKNERYIRLVWDKERLLSVNLLNMKEIAGVLKHLFLKTAGGGPGTPSTIAGEDLPAADPDISGAVPGSAAMSLDYREFARNIIKKYMNE